MQTFRTRFAWTVTASVVIGLLGAWIVDLLFAPLIGYDFRLSHKPVGFALATVLVWVPLSAMCRGGRLRRAIAFGAITPLWIAMIFPITALDGHAGFAALFLTPFLIPFGIATGGAVWWGVADQSPLNRSGAAPAPEGDLPA